MSQLKVLLHDQLAHCNNKEMEGQPKENGLEVKLRAQSSKDKREQKKKS